MPPAIENRIDLAERLDQMGVEVRFDARDGFPVIDGQKASTQQFHALLDRSAIEPGLILPNTATEKGLRIWDAFYLEHSFDPLVEWLEDCAAGSTALDPGDLPGVLWGDRVEPDFAELVEWSWRALFTAVVARAFDPPAKWDIVPIIVGEQGCGKSTAVTGLLPEQWTNGGFPLRGVKDFDSGRKTLEFTEGKAILESSEMVGLKRGQVENVKSFISQTTDRATRKYARRADDVPRRWVIVGTTNDCQPIPHDRSGGRRWIVTRIYGVLPTDGLDQYRTLEEVRRFYWAGAVDLYREGFDLSVPEHLRDMHAEMVDRYMWKPASEGGDIMAQIMEA